MKTESHSDGVASHRDAIAAKREDRADIERGGSKSGESMKEGKSETATEITEGLPPAWPIHDERAEPVEPDIRVNEPTAIQVFFVWEKLRLVHNALFVLALLLRYGGSWRSQFTSYEWFLILATVNACFCTGPIAESYLTCFGVPRWAARWSVFLIGTLVVILFALGVVWLPAPGPGERPLNDDK